MTNSFFPDHQKTVVIPARWQGGEWKPFYGGEMPEIKEGSMAELTLSIDALRNSTEARRFTVERETELLPAGTRLWARMTKNHYRGALKKGVPTGYRSDHRHGIEEAILVPFHIEEPLKLLLRGTKSAQLQPCPCHLPDFDETVEVLSINQAYTRLSELYEPTRKSHSGNVFDQVFFADGSLLLPLAALRLRKEAEAEAELFHQSGELPLKEES